MIIETGNLIHNGVGKFTVVQGYKYAERGYYTSKSHYVNSKYLSLLQMIV